MPARGRTPSGHDIPIPESVYVHMQVLDGKIEGVRVDVAAVEAKVDKLTAAVTKLAGRKRGDIATVIGAVASAVAIILGAVKAMMPTPEPVRTEVHYTPVDPRMSDCSSFQPGTQAQGECFARVQAEIQSGKRPASTTP